MIPAILLILGIIHFIWSICSTAYWVVEGDFDYVLWDALEKDWDWQILDAAEDMNERGKTLTLIFSVIVFPWLYIAAAVYRFCHDLED